METKNSSIANKIIFFIILSSLTVAVIGTSISLNRDFEKYKKDIQARFLDIEKSLLPPLSSALYSEDTGQIKNGINGILKMPDIVYVEIRNPEEEEIAYKSGKPQSENSIHKDIKVTFSEDPDAKGEDLEHIADLKITASLAGATEKIKDQIFVFALIQGSQIIIIMILIYYIFSKMVAKPLSIMAAFAENLDLDDLSAENLNLGRNKGRSEDELDKVVNSFNKMKDNLKVSHEKLKDYAENLEEKVKLATKEIEEEKNKVGNLLNNMKQAIFSIDSEGNIKTPVSDFASEVFGQSIIDKNIYDVLYKDVDPKSELYANISTVFALIFNEDIIQFEIAEYYLPERMIIKDFRSEEEKVLKISNAPLWDDNNLLSQLMYVIEDVTEKEKLALEIEEKKKSNEKNISIITEMANSDLEEVRFFLKNAAKLVEDSMTLVKMVPSEKNILEEIFRALHTLKGNARVFKFDSISSLTHLTEDKVTTIREKIEEGEEFSPTRKTYNPVIDNLYMLNQEVNDYSSLAKKVFRIENEFEKKVMEDVRNYITDIDNIINARISSKDNSFPSKESKKEKRRFFEEIVKNPPSQDDLDELFRVTHSLKGALRSHSSLKDFSEYAHLFEQAVDGLLSNKEADLDDFTKNFIEVIFELKSSIGPFFTKKDVNNYTSLFLEEWIVVFEDIFELTLNVDVENKEFKEGFEKILFNLKKEAEKLNTSLIVKMCNDLQNFFMKPKNYVWNIIPTIIGDLWTFMALLSKMEFSKIENKQEIERIYNMFKEIDDHIGRSGEKLEEVLYTELAKQHSYLLMGVLGNLQRKKVSLDKFFVLAKKWVRGDDFLYDRFICQPSYQIASDKIVSAFANADYSKGLPDKINDMALEGDSVCKSISSFFNKYSYYTYLKLIDVNQLVDSFYLFNSDKEETGIKVRTWPVVLKNLDKLEELADRINNEEIMLAVKKLKEIPVTPALNKFKSMVNEISNRLNKNVDLSIQGANVTMEKDSYNILQDALVHLLRNSLDHGIETPEERKKCGKDSVGKITLSCEELESGYINLTIKDDGKGINADVIGKKAVERGIYSDEDLKKMNRDEIINTIFLPSFSQKDEADELSGRGIGMDVVKKNLEDLQGSVEVNTVVGEGTEFILRFKSNKRG